MTRIAALLTVVMVSVFLLIISPTFCFADKQEAMADEAMKHLGEHYLGNTSGEIGDTTPFIWSGKECIAWQEYQVSCIGVRHFDCSGFVSFCAKAVGFNLGHLGPQYFYDEGPIVHVPLSDVRKGTIIFKKYGDDISHVAIYGGNGNVVECGGGEGRVHITLWSAWLDGASRGYYQLLAGDLLSVEPTNGSCCVSGNCTTTTQANCSGTWTTGGTCNPNPCPQPPATGSCCAANGTCTVTTLANCSGTWTSGGTCSTPCKPCQFGLCGVCLVPGMLLSIMGTFGMKRRFRRRDKVMGWIRNGDLDRSSVP